MLTAAKPKTESARISRCTTGLVRIQVLKARPPIPHIFSSCPNFGRRNVPPEFSTLSTVSTGPTATTKKITNGIQHARKDPLKKRRFPSSKTGPPQQALRDDTGLDKEVISIHFAFDSIAILGRLAMKVLVAASASQRRHRFHPEVI